MTDPTPSAGTPSDNRTIMIVLSYLWLLALVPLLVEKGDREVQWHAKHGIVLMVAEIVLWVAWTIISTLIAQIPVLGCLGAAVGALVAFIVWLGIIVLHVFAMVKGVNGQRLIVPYVSRYADQF
ncbi:MAG TPA: hypothetical protein VK911_01160 [Vicinamibacterales bacterium]|nr:hypothetical protein [Vicinamibacterales bacterium]